MKRLLLSTALILGTLSGVKGVLPDVQHAVSPTVGQDQAAATVVAHVDPQPALETEEPTAETKFELILKQLMAEVASLRRSVETTSEQLASKVIALENRQGTMNATLLRLAPPTPAVVADIDDLFADAFTSTDFLIKDRALKTISEQLNTMGLYPSSTAEARQSIATSINEFINSITNYKSSTIWTPQLYAVIVMCTCVDLYLYVLFLCSVEKESTWRLGILVPMGGASTLGVFLAALTKIFTWWKEGKTSDATIQIQKSWNNIFSNPQEKTFLVKTLTQYWVSKNLPDSSAILRKIFLTANTTQQLYAELQKLNTPLSTSDAATIN